MNSNICERNYGIDLLKIVSMFMVVILHVINHGGLLWKTVELTLNDSLVWFIYIICFPAVNLFALTTGYLCINKKFKYKNLINLYILVLFYSIVYTILFKGFDFIPFITSFFPVSNNAYWYFSAYFCFILFIPYINKFLNSIDQNEYKKLIFLIIFIMCGIGWLSRILNADIVSIRDGYSPLWLASLYVIGGYFKLYNSKIKNYSKKTYFIFYIFISLFTLLSRIILIKIPMIRDFIPIDIFIRYNAVTIFFSAISIFLLFIRINIKDNYKKKLVFFSGLSFSVYIVHEHRLMRNIILNNKYAFFVSMPFYQMIFMILFTGVIIYVLATIIDIVRYYLFKFLKAEKFSEWLDKKIVLMLTKKG